MAEIFGRVLGYATEQMQSKALDKIFGRVLGYATELMQSKAKIPRANQRHAFSKNAESDLPSTPPN